MEFYYLAILAPESVNRTVLEWKRHLFDRYGSKVALKSPAHITLVPPFKMEEQLERNLRDNLRHFCHAIPAFSISLENFGAFPPRVIYIRVLKNLVLESVKISLEEYLGRQQQFPIQPDTRPFKPHITLANRDLRQADFNEAYDWFKSKIYKESFTALRIAVLKHNGRFWETAFEENLAT